MRVVKPRLPKWISQALPVVQATILIACVLTWVSVQSHVDYLERTSPRTPDTATGETVPVFWKTLYVYMTPENARMVRYSHYLDVLALALVAVLVLPRIYRSVKQLIDSRMG